MQKSFSFKGITRNSDNLLVADGECMELINLRVKDGCLEPYPSGYNETELECCFSKIYWHPAAEMFLCLEYNNEGRVYIYDKNFRIVRERTTGDSVYFPSLKGVERIEFVGNIVCCIAETTTYYFIYDSVEYRWLGARPDMPELSFSCESLVYEAVSDDEYVAGYSYRNGDASLRWGNVAKGYFDQALSMLHSRGYYVDRALFRYALRLFDGTHFCYSPIYYVDDDSTNNGLARDAANFQSEPLNPGALSSKYVAKVQGFIPAFHLKNLNLAAWENIIVGIDIFTTGSIYGHKIARSNEKWSSRNGVYHSDETGYERYVEKSGQEILNDVASAASFYKVAEYNIFGVLVDNVVDVSLSSLALCENLPDDSGSLVDRKAAYSYFFNGRLHLAGLKEMFMKGYNPRVYLPANVTPSRADYALVVTRLKTTAGISVVKREYIRDFTLGLENGELSMSPYIMYPDSRAFEITFTITMGETTYRRTFPLNRHKTLNLAHYINASGSLYEVTLEAHLANGATPSSYAENNILAYFSYTPGVYLISYVANGIWYYEGKPFVLRDGPDGNRYYRMLSILSPRAGDTITITIKRSSSITEVTGVEDIKLDDTWEVIEDIEDIEEENACDVRANVMKVSAVDNPFYFPAKNTYSPSREAIVAMCSNTVALSQGQFGQHPLYLFCRDGVWAMQSDASGGVTYATAHPVAREICVNAASVRSASSGIVFLGKKGLMLLQGNTLKCLSAVIDADSHFMQNVVVRDLLYRIAMIADNHYSLSRRSFNEYINGEIAVEYIHAENEIWVSNNAYEYSYVYSLDNGTWTKISRSFICFVNAYPRQLCMRIIDDKSYVAVIDRNNVEPYSYITLLTRPQLWGSKLPKRILQFMLHAAIKSATSAPAYFYPGLACYLLCSNDGVHFKLVAGAEKNKDFNDIVFPYFPTKAYKYYIIALSGTVGNDSRIVGTELSIAAAWENRLR
ncbi:MAG: hypothetical protein IJY98_08150 [Bacteroidaceae bacterium]|nr:hypothetical protein [Bacteroidaceae bacterium]